MPPNSPATGTKYRSKGKEFAMAYATKRGPKKYTGYYRDVLGKRKSVGTFETKNAALDAARYAERYPGRVFTGATEDRSYSEYVHHWLKTEEDITSGTKRGYESAMIKWILPIIGHLRVAEITPRVVKALLAELAEQGMSPWMRQQCKAAIGSSFKPIVPEVVMHNPAHGIRVKLPPSKEFDLLTPVEFKRIVDCLPDEGSKLFARFLAVTGSRFGEATEVRVKDFNFRLNKVSIVRRVAAPSAGSANGSRFEVIPGTKAGQNRGRHIPLPAGFMDEVMDWVREHQLKSEDLVFSRSLIARVSYADDRLPDGPTFMVGTREFRHGTPYAYTGGGCRCPECLTAVREYRRDLARRKGVPTQKRTNITGHLANDQWARIWRKAVEESGIGWKPRTHDLRHACATQMIADGISLKEVMSRLGHSQMATTARYQHRVEIEMGKAVESVSAFL
jgi:integrase